MVKIAIDIVLLPSDEIMDKVVAMSNDLFKETNNDTIILNKKDCLPHVSLAMGCINEGDLPKIEKILKDISSRFKPFNLKFTKVDFVTTPKGETVSGLSIEKTSKLQELHEKIMDKLTKYFTENVTISALYPKPKPEETTLFWINGFRDKSSFENFSPHITIGFGELKNINFPIIGNTKKLAICHLGNYCTCRKVLASINLVI